MCGFVGLLGNKNNWLGSKLINTELDRMSKVILERGPDNYHKYISDEEMLGLAFRRLSILDLSISAQQPMLARSKNWIIVFNGEIYNFQEIREIVNNNKDFWRTKSDSEAVVECIDKFGFEKTIFQLNGMFSIAAYCFSKKELWLCRDRFGEKPLYYSKSQKNGFYFASEIKSFISSNIFNKDLSPTAISNFLRYGYVPERLSILKNTYKLAPGSLLRLDKFGNIKIEKYWDTYQEFENINKKQFNLGLVETENKLKTLVDKSVKSRTISDVAVGAFLSGGIDSSNIVLSLVEQGLNVETFSVGFEDKKTNELFYANKVADILNVKHNQIIIDENTCKAEIEKVISAYDEPFSDPSQIPTFILSKFARKKIKVALSGDGADELFGGYPRYYKLPNNWLKLRRYPKFLKKILLQISFRLGSNQNKISSAIGKKFRKLSNDSLENLHCDEMSRWRPDENLYDYKKLGDTHFDYIRDEKFKVSDFRYLTLRDLNTYLPSCLLVKIDRASMANSLEVRNPFLDHELVKFVFSLPDDYLFFKSQPKALLKRRLSKHIPSNILNREKQGFEPPLDLWLRTGLKEWMNDLISTEDGYLDNNYIKTISERFMKGEKKLTYKLWTIIMFKAWINSFSARKKVVF